MGGLKYVAGSVAMIFLAENIKNPEQRYLLLAVVAGVVGAIETAWRDRIKAQRDECRDQWENGGR